MQFIKPSVELNWYTTNPLDVIEKIGRICYRSEEKITETSNVSFVQKLIKNEHLAMIEHASISMTFICDTGVSHELVRHRLFSFAQESTRYCDYEKSGIRYIIPPGIEIKWKQTEYDGIILDKTEMDHKSLAWYYGMQEIEALYNFLRASGCSPQIARSVLPKALATKIAVTGNLREWLHFFKLRTATTAHPQMREVANLALQIAQTISPVIFTNNEKLNEQ